MELYLDTGLIFSSVFCAVLIIRHRLNVLRSFPFLVNILFLFTYYFPVIVLGLNVSQAATWLILAGHISMNMGLLAGHIFSWVLFSGKKVVLPADNGVFSLPTMNFLILMFLVGVAGYLVLYSVRGVPLFSDDVDIAREAFVSGAGIITWPSSLLINSSVWMLALRGNSRTAFVLGVIGVGCLALTGWRGQIIFMVLSLLFAFSYRNGINKKMALLGIAGILGVAAFGILRSNMTGHALYGLQIAGESGTDTLLSVVELGGLYILRRLGEHAYNFNVAVSHFYLNPLGGAGMVMDFLVLMPGKSMTVAGYMKDRFGEWEGGGGMPITMLGGFFVDFGTVGMISLSFIASFIQIIIVKAFARLAEHNRIFSIPPGFMSNFWVFGFLGTYFRDFLPYTLIYCIGIMGVLFFYRATVSIKKTIFARA